MLYQTHAVVSLQNIKKNLLGIKKKIGKKRKILVAVKADAYGHGALEVSRLAEKLKLEWLGVATVNEGLALRQSKIKLPILKFSPCFKEELLAAIKGKITLTICSIQNAKEIEQTLVKLKIRKYKCHIKLDTGMGRIGVLPEEVIELASFVKSKCPHLEIEGVYTHFPVSDMPERDDFTRKQIILFKELVVGIEKELGYKIPLKHMANSGGILAHEESYFDLVRPGIMTYGFYPDKTTPQTIPLYPALSFYSRVSFVKKVKVHTPISYGGTWQTPEDGFVATIPVGYADGFNRLLSNNGRVLIGGKSYPIVGRVCMDQSLVYLGSETKVKVGDKVTLIGKDGNEEISTYELAEKLKTITYEITCQINKRVQRIYR